MTSSKRARGQRHHIALLFVAVVATVIVSCVRIPSQGVILESIKVPASFGRTWDAYLAVLREAGINPEAAVRDSGKISGTWTPLPSNVSTAHVSDCGAAFGTRIPPTHLDYIISITGDSGSSVLLLRTQWRYLQAQGKPVTIRCGSTGTWENEITTRVIAQAQSRK